MIYLRWHLPCSQVNQQLCPFLLIQIETVQLIWSFSSQVLLGPTSLMK